jgi:HAD superfamily hydrolase (TIGR01662 family)
MDAMYFAPDLSTDALNRKPNPGMAYQAVKQYPDIDLSKSIMVGNRLSDMQFGKNVGMTTVYVATTHPIEPNPILIDYYLKDISELADIL